jgi:uroporphyrinogen III methyltransferase/synthase
MVYLVGAGPGDAELIACKGRRVLEEAEVVVFEPGVNPAVVDFAPAVAERIPDGGVETLIDRARRGLKVVWLGGDEPAADLVAAGVRFEIVPGAPAPPDFARLPLFAKRIAVTRAQAQADALAGRLRALGAGVVEIPTIEIRPAAEYGPLDRAIAELDCYDWLIFSSVNGVRFFLERLDRSAVDLRALRAKICAIGPATRAAVEALHLKVDLMGQEYVAEGLLEAFAAHDLAGRRVLLPRAAVARDLVPVELAKRGARVDVVEAYRTVVPEGAAALVRAAFAGLRKPDFITFTSSSTVRNFVDAAGVETLRGVKAVSIGPVTTRTARNLGIEVAAEARVYTLGGLVEAILAMCETGATSPRNA